jgi:hypothetical protein
MLLNLFKYAKFKNWLGFVLNVHMNSKHSKQKNVLKDLTPNYINIYK